MIKELHIKNYALIKSLHLKLHPGLNIITGETGAGKSIILGALGLILGNRADGKFLENNTDKCVIEGNFQVQKHLKPLFDELEVDFDLQTILRREINPNGKSRAFINDSPVSLQTLKQIGENLVDIHSQHSNLLLADSSFKIAVIDTLAENQELLNQYQTDFKNYKLNLKKWESLKEEQANLARDRDYFQFQYDEIDKLKLKPDEYAENEKELDKLSHAEKIDTALAASLTTLEEGENAAITLLNDALKNLQTVSRYDEKLQHLLQRLQSTQIELKDISSEISIYSRDIEVNPEKLEELNERQQQVQKLLRKHSLEKIDDLLAFCNDLANKINQADNAVFDLEKLEKLLKESKTQCVQSASQLCKARLAVCEGFAQKMLALLKGLGIPDAQFFVEMEDLPFEKYQLSGSQKIQFMFTANPGIKPSAVHQGASGGELSRIMLAIKYLMAGSSRFPTMIFDEIDLGISGEVAIQMGKIIQKLSQQHQVISITHLPQIAAMGQAHFKVSKQRVAEDTIATLQQLDKQERVLELGQMIGGIKPGEQALQSAKELLRKFAIN